MVQHDPANGRVAGLSAEPYPAAPGVAAAGSLEAAVAPPDVVASAPDVIVPVPARSVGHLASRTLKRTVDIAAGAVGLAITLALFPIAVLLVSLDSPGPVIYGQRRVGRDTRHRPADRATRRRTVDYGGRPFTVFKLRTMRCDAESQGPRLAVEGDPRATRVGRFLRRYHFDEWPQFLCILNGDMSLVGPRPERPFFATQYRRQIPGYEWRTAGIRPGLIGLSQVLVGYDHSMASVRAKAKLDASYRDLVVSDACRWPAVDAHVVLQTARYMAGRRPDGDVESPPPPARIRQAEERAD